MKPEPLSSAPSTPATIFKRPRAVSAEMSIRKRPGPVTRALKSLDTPAEEDAGERLEPLEPLNKLLGGNAGAAELGNGEA